VISLALLVPGLLGVALWSGFPLLYFDSSWYITDAFEYLHPRDKTLIYPMIIRGAFRFYRSLWSVAALQSICLLYVLWQTLAVVAAELAYYLRCALIVLLVLLSPVSWAVSHVMPDALSGAFLLSFYLCLCRRPKGLIHRFLLTVIFVISCGSHSSHIMIATVLAIFVLVFRRHLIGDVLTRVVAIRASALLGVAAGLLLWLNYIRTDRVYLLGSRSAFLLNHLLEVGVIQQLLRDHCDDTDYVLCPHQSKLKSRRLFIMFEDKDNTLEKIGGWEHSWPVVKPMVLDALYYYPVENLAWISRQFLGQLIQFDYPIFIFSFPKEDPVLPAVRRVSAFDRMAFDRSRQQSGALYSLALANFYQVIFWTSLIFSFYRISRDPFGLGRLGEMTRYLVLALLCNALVCSICAHDEPRYQARIAWLIPFAGFTILIRYGTGRARPIPQES
jgi:hypothetical protein